MSGKTIQHKLSTPKGIAMNAATQNKGGRRLAATASFESGERGIRTPGTGFPAHGISSAAQSATLSSLRETANGGQNVRSGGSACGVKDFRRRIPNSERRTRSLLLFLFFLSFSSLFVLFAFALLLLGGLFFGGGFRLFARFGFLAGFLGLFLGDGGREFIDLVLGDCFVARLCGDRRFEPGFDRVAGRIQFAPGGVFAAGLVFDFFSVQLFDPDGEIFVRAAELTFEGGFIQRHVRSFFLR